MLLPRSTRAASRRGAGRRRRDAARRRRRALHRAGRPARPPPASATTLRLAVDPARFHFFDPADGRSLLAAAASRQRPSSLRRRARPAGAVWPPVTKQSQTREQVLDLIERLDVGDAIPSERQLSADLGVSRLTVRAALDDLVREGYLVRRRGSGTFVSEPKIAQELTMTSFTEDMRRRGMSPASRTLSLDDRPRGRAARPLPPRLAVGADRGREAPAAGRPRDDGDRDAARPRGARARADRRAISSAARSTSCCGSATASRSPAACRRSSRR